MDVLVAVDDIPVPISVIMMITSTLPRM
jgi:hypothetical protein